MQINELHKIEQDTDNLPTIDIIFPLHARQWCISYFLDNILKLDYPKDKISIITYLNNAFDGSDQIMYNFKKENINQYKKIDIITYNINIPKYDNNGQRGGTKIVNSSIGGSMHIAKVKNTAYDVYKGLAKLRNLLLNRVTSDFAFSIDTDIICKSNTLKELVKLDKDFVSCLICNGYMVNKVNPYIYPNIMRKENDKYIHITDYENKGLISVDLSGAISLMSNKLCKSGAKYGFSIYGEDAEFCASAQKLGFELFCQTNLKCTHLMSQEYLDKYLKGEFIF